MAMLKLGRWLRPAKLDAFWKKRKRSRFKLLDVGCGNHSPTLTCYWYPQVEYSGLDREIYNNSEADRVQMRSFYRVDLQHDTLGDLPADYFDVIIMAHVIEHLPNGLGVVAELAGKLAPGGDFYIEFPSVRSLRLPSGRQSLHFCDDPTHVRLYAVGEIVNLLLEHDCVIQRAGRRRRPAGLMVALATLPWQAWSLLRYRRLLGPPLWDLLGFADFVHAVRRDPSRTES